MKKLEKIFDNKKYRIYIVEYFSEWEFLKKTKYLVYKKILGFIWIDIQFSKLEDAMEFVETGKINKEKKKQYWEALRNGTGEI